MRQRFTVYRRPFILHPSSFILYAVPAFLAVLLAVPARGAPADDLAQSARQLRAGYATAIEDLAKWCLQHHLAPQADQTRQALGRQDPYRFYLAILPKKAGGEPLPAGAAEDLVKWDERFTRLRHEHADALYDLARRAVKAQRASLAADLVLCAIVANPDHEAIRRMMGQQNVKGQWCTPYELHHPAAQVKRDRSGWLVIETEHYSIRTDHTAEAGTRLSAKLEELYRIWQQMFLRYYMSEAQVAAAFEGRPQPRGKEPARHRIVYFRDRDDYLGNLQNLVPNIEKSIGFYSPHTKMAYFYESKQPDDRTLFHEATHQLFQETRPTVSDPGSLANFWVFEGIAMFMESLRKEEDFYVLGGPNDVRLHAAQVRLLNDKFYVPLEEFTTYGRLRLQNDPRIATLYSQAAGLTHFLIFADNGRYRDDLVKYLLAIYTGSDEPSTLAALTHATYADLDGQYRRFIEASAQAAQAPAETHP